MIHDPHLATEEDEDGIEFVAGSMVPIFPFERKDGALVLKIYSQEGVLTDLPVPDTRDNEIFGVWMRRFDRYTLKTQ